MRDAFLIVTEHSEITAESIEFALRLYDASVHVIPMQRVEVGEDDDEPAEDDKTNDWEVDDAVPV